MKFIIIHFLLFFILPSGIIAQDTEHYQHINDHEHHRHEVGIGNSPVYFVKEKIIAYGLHLHYVYNLPKSDFGLGVAYERIFDAHKHNTIGIVGNYRPIERLSFSFTPGLAFEDYASAEINFAMHFETAYEFEIFHFHIGPLFEVAYDPEDYHISLGLHIGYGF